MGIDHSETYTPRQPAGGLLQDPVAALRRIEKLETERRRVRRSRDRCREGSDYARELDQQLVELEERIEHWGKLLARAEAEGFKVWTPADFAKGDFVRYRGTWYEVLRVNAKSLTIPHAPAVGRDVVLGGDGGRLGGGTWTAPYSDGVTGRMGPEEMHAYLAARDGGENRE
ncbi:hypothetical protein [Streptomyces africanus]|uniref:hypothetical protein n=1 Tax=Streptomyces africanus TaxID=231024 RepID=UPI000A3C5A27|nr:hypothetical protein [Streptomyces africanus]